MPYLDLKDIKLYYEAYGEGPPFLFISETACDGAVWKLFQVPEFSRDHRVIIFDYRGTGLSGKPSVKYTTNIFVDDIVALLDHLGAEQVIVCGHSMGGRVAQLLSLEHPRKVKQLILASTGAAHPGMKGIPLRLSKEMVERGYERYVREHTIEVGWSEEYVGTHRDLIDKYLEVRMANLAPLECYLRHVIARQEHDTSGGLKDIKVPTLILVGDDDHGVTSDLSHRAGADILARGIPNSKLVVLPNERHSYFFTNPGAAHKIIREFITT
ncbi:MAG: alpha/beta hydrolase [Deltaproteobacteria bacterium]|nr:alpha/beta hydrolase [Deltaproteobacteria bacterium]